MRNQLIGIRLDKKTLLFLEKESKRLGLSKQDYLRLMINYHKNNKEEVRI